MIGGCPSTIPQPWPSMLKSTSPPPPSSSNFFFLLLYLLFTSQVSPGQMHFTTQNHPGDVDRVQRGKSFVTPTQWGLRVKQTHRNKGGINSNPWSAEANSPQDRLKEAQVKLFDSEACGRRMWTSYGGFGCTDGVFLRLAFVPTKFRSFMCPNSQDCNGNAYGGMIR